MKKLTPLVMVAAFGMMMFASCKKDYTCTCKVAGQTISVPFNGVKKKDAKSGCDAAQTTYRNADAEASCSL